MSINGGWYAAQAKTNPDLFRVIFDFNRRPQSWVHPSVIDSLPHAPVVRALSSTLHGGRHLSAWLDEQLQLKQEDACWDFSQPRLRIALLSPGTLHRLARYAGAAACWPRVAATISRDDLREVKAALGEDAHVFALRRGRMIVPEKETIPAVDNTPLAAHALDLGWRTIACAVENDAPALDRRFTLKLPPEVATALATKTVAAPEVREKSWQRLRRIGPEVFTEGELKCFA